MPGGKPRVLIGTSSFGVGDSSPLDRLKDAGFEIVPNPFGRKLTEAELVQLLPGVQGLIAGLEPLNRNVLSRSSLKVISRCGAGMSNVDLRAAAELGITVLNTPDAPTQAVAELTVGAMVALLRKLPAADRDVREGRWSKQLGAQLNGKTVVIVGFGRIGRRVARLLGGFDVRRMAVDIALQGEVDGVSVVTLEEGLPLADVVTLHSSGEREILGERELARLKRGAYVLNCGRGGQINEAALCAALDRGQIAGAWLDVFQEEPYHGPLTQYSQVILSPHVGSYTAECRSQMEMESVDNLIAAFRRS